MMNRFRQLILVLLATWMTGSLAWSAPVAAQVDAGEAVQRAAIDLLRIEGSRDANRLYDRMAPESRMIIPRQGLATWLQDPRLMVPVGEPEILDITFGDWESDATGEAYEEVAFVEYSVPVASERREDVRESEMVLWNDGLTWRWFFSGKDDAIDDVAGMAEWTIDYASPYRTKIYQEVDVFWAQVFANAGLDYHPPVDMVGIRVDAQPTGCGIEDEIEQMAVHYCTLDQTIYYDPGFRDQIVAAFGDYAWTHIMTHEWAHHIQNLLGLYTSRDPELQGGMYTIESELQADCLAGVFSQDARARGLIRNRDLNDAVDVAEIAGDARGTTWDDITAHGSAEQREQSFWLGYDDGLRGCHVDLEVQGQE